MPIRKSAPTPSEFIREYLLGSITVQDKAKDEILASVNGEDYVGHMCRAYNIYLKDQGYSSCSYKSFQGYVWVLKTLGGLELVRLEPVTDRGYLHDILGMTKMQPGAYRHYYRVVLGTENEPYWTAPRLMMRHQAEGGIKIGKE